ncbi:stress-related protein isoform X1 [Hevea brasiliensis]|uniref:stress-related protein isoform X1 n=2 Tax=Hevea brasiliensis TaxID=3981 RepID=UPI0025DAB729|nr:stress-related protein isoform X1 [Hevea brasiliensis]
MAESEMEQHTEMVQDNDKTPKYLDFVQVATIYVIICFSTIYDYAKENSGPLKPGVQTVEGTVKMVIGPVYEKFCDVPFELLKFVDRKVNILICLFLPTPRGIIVTGFWGSRAMQVDDALSELDRHVPSLVKQASSQARAVACEVQRAGIVEAAKSIAKTMYTKYEPTAKELYCKYEPVAEHYAVSAWHTLNRLPLFPQAAQVVVPTAARWSEKYNQLVSYAADRGYTAAAYVPLIPIERIAKVFHEGVNGPTVPTNE